ncbi:MAG TPA: right-handed parallel beta-helix repeat-containing protein [Streptosporangiaceae bacterium]
MNTARRAFTACLSLSFCLALGACSSSAPGGATSVTCQGNSGDAARIQAVIGQSEPGATIQIGGGTCLLTRDVVLSGNRTYAGGSTTGTVLKQGAAMAFMLASSDYAGNSTTTGDPLQIRDLTLACDGTGRTDGIVILNWRVDVSQVNVHDCGGSGIVDTSVPADGKPITNTSVNSRFENNFVTGSGQYGFAVIDPVNAVTDGFFTDNQVADSGSDGVYLQNAEGWNISGNHLYGDGGDGIDAARLYGTTISSNYIEDFGVGQRTGTWSGIVGTAQDGPGSVLLGNKVFSLVAERNGASHRYIAVTKANSGTGHVSAYANVIETVAKADQAFYFNGTPHSLVVAFGANQVSGPGAARVLGGGVSISSGT